MVLLANKTRYVSHLLIIRISLHETVFYRIFTTHNLSVLKNADYLIKMNKGSIEYQGTYAQFNDESFFKEEEAESLKKLEQVQAKNNPSAASASTVNNGNKIIVEDFRVTGKLTISTILQYCSKLGGIIPVFAVLMVFVLAQLLSLCCDYFLVAVTSKYFPLALWVQMIFYSILTLLYVLFTI